MKIIDSKGRLFGKLSILDLAAACVILLVVVGVFFFPGTPLTKSIIAQTKLKPIEVKVLVRGLGVTNLDGLVQEFTGDKQADIVIRNQPAGKVKIVDSELLPRTTPVPQPDGTVKALPDPRPEINMIRDILLTLDTKAEVTNNGYVLGGSKKVKIGSSIQLQGNVYDFNGTIVAIEPEDV
ncbi:DUF4330 domain-containing protein [Pleurocapsales cyanobacterium LEGE 10410]|nr:DUF4330 domain-containing protein [Pleurocapsales cyanobacterium LEGE 10410]